MQRMIVDLLLKIFASLDCLSEINEMIRHHPEKDAINIFYEYSRNVIFLKNDPNFTNAISC